MPLLRHRSHWLLSCVAARAAAVGRNLEAAMGSRESEGSSQKQDKAHPLAAVLTEIRQQGQGSTSPAMLSLWQAVDSSLQPVLGFLGSAGDPDTPESSTNAVDETRPCLDLQEYCCDVRPPLSNSALLNGALFYWCGAFRGHSGIPSTWLMHA